MSRLDSRSYAIAYSGARVARLSEGALNYVITNKRLLTGRLVKILLYREVSTMKSNTQNAKIEAITEKTLVLGIDIGSEMHYARAFDYRGIEYSKKPFKFSNTEAGFVTFKEWILDLKERHEKDKVIPGMEPTGHYWFNLGKFLQDNEMKPVLVNPHHVKKSKELDDNNPTKNDRKDPKVIAGLVREGRYMIPYLPDGVYADLRTASNIRDLVRQYIMNPDWYIKLKENDLSSITMGCIRIYDEIQCLNSLYPEFLSLSDKETLLEYLAECWEYGRNQFEKNVSTEFYNKEFTDRYQTMERVIGSFSIVQLNQPLKGYISTLSYANMMYVMRKQLTPDQIEEVFRKLNLIFEFADFSPAVLERAVNMKWKDFGDAVQSATAESVHADYIITRKVSEIGR